MTFEKIVIALIIVMGVAFVYQYTKRLVAESKAKDLEQDFEILVEAIHQAKEKNRLIERDLKTPAAKAVLSEYFKAFLMIKMAREELSKALKDDH